MQFGTLYKKIVSCSMRTNLGWQECVMKENELACMEIKDLI
jgi:hypothetical protein